MRILILTPDPGYGEEWRWAYDVEAEALARNGHEVAHRPWTEVGDPAGFDLVVPLVAWGYNRDFARWLEFLDRAEAERWPLANPAALLRWNSDKAYLVALADAGVPVVATRRVEALDEAELALARDAFGDALVIKPPVSAAADGTHRLAAGDPIPAAALGRPMMIQPFLASIADEGEYSLILFAGQFSHCVVKRPRAGDYRVQPHLGGSEQPCAPPAGAIALANAALAAAPARASYARVDMLRDRDGQLAIIELELIEPALWLQHSPDAGAAFASTLAALGAR
jgi:glutathione synthase/RimK-type ligase-like ATP-grasp enzyme